MAETSTAKAITKKSAQATQKIAEPRYPKDQILESKSYQKHRDVLEALLEEGKSYTMQEAKLVIENYQKRKL